MGDKMDRNLSLKGMWIGIRPTKTGDCRVVLSMNAKSTWFDVFKNGPLIGCVVKDGVLSFGPSDTGYKPRTNSRWTGGADVRLWASHDSSFKPFRTEPIPDDAWSFDPKTGWYSIVLSKLEQAEHASDPYAEANVVDTLKGNLTSLNKMVHEGKVKLAVNDDGTLQITLTSVKVL